MICYDHTEGFLGLRWKQRKRLTVLVSFFNGCSLQCHQTWQLENPWTKWRLLDGKIKQRLIVTHEILLISLPSPKSTYIDPAKYGFGRLVSTKNWLSSQSMSMSVFRVYVYVSLWDGSSSWNTSNIIDCWFYILLNLVHLPWPWEYSRIPLIPLMLSLYEGFLKWGYP